MTVREMLKQMKKEAKKSGIIDKEIWESPSGVRCKSTLLVSTNAEADENRLLDHYEIGYRHGGEEPIKVICKKC